MAVTFAVLSDPHLTLPHTLRDYPQRSHFLEVSMGVLEAVLAAIGEVDFLLIPGDLTQDGEIENHRWLAERLARLPFPSYVIPGNHDFRSPVTEGKLLGPADFQGLYGRPPYFSCEVAKGVQLIALNSTWFAEGKVRHDLGEVQEAWLQRALAEAQGETILAMVHHNVLEHIPHQSRNPLTEGYMLNGHQRLAQLLRQSGVKWVFTGHFHVQDIAHQMGLYDITTGSLVSYPHPFRICRLENGQLSIRSQRVTQLPQWPDLAQFSFRRTCQMSARYLNRLLTGPPLALTAAEAAPYLPHLEDFWAKVCAGDAHFDLAHLPTPVRTYFERFNDLPPADNNVVL